jgi:hypothetical protein
VKLGSVKISTPGLPDRVIGAGDIIDQAELDSSSLWESTAVATQASDLIVFRGRLLRYLGKDLRIVKRA